VNGVVPSAAGPVQRAHSDGHGARCAFAQKASPIRLTDPLGGLSWILARCTDTDGWMSEVNVTISVPEPVHLLRQPTPTQIDGLHSMPTSHAPAGVNSSQQHHGSISILADDKVGPGTGIYCPSKVPGVPLFFNVSSSQTSVFKRVAKGLSTVVVRSPTRYHDR
jgi:hypothetical protein